MAAHVRAMDPVLPGIWKVREEGTVTRMLVVTLMGMVVVNVQAGHKE